MPLPVGEVAQAKPARVRDRQEILRGTHMRKIVVARSARLDRQGRLSY
jgi:hypothetical protein